MVLSDRKHAAEIRAKSAQGRSKVHFFDDIGCAVMWLQDKPFRDAPGTEIWVTDWRTGKWIDARKAYYLPGQVTPMDYGLGAQSEPQHGALTFAQAEAHILEVEKDGGHRMHMGAAPLRGPVSNGTAICPRRPACSRLRRLSQKATASAAQGRTAVFGGCKPLKT
jgi:hypothetical protein